MLYNVIHAKEKTILLRSISYITCMIDRTTKTDYVSRISTIAIITIEY